MFYVFYIILIKNRFLVKFFRTLPGVRSRAGAVFVPEETFFSEKKKSYFFIQMYISAYFDPPATFRTCPDGSGHIFLYI